jgi:hypothetical protein
LRNPDSFFVIGTLLLTQTIQTDLLPRIEVWPESHSGITKLLQTTDLQLLAIHVPANNALNTHIYDLPYSTDDNSLLAKSLSFTSGTFDGIDNNGHAVLASYQPVGYTGWHVVLQQNKDEVLAPLYNQLIWIALFSLYRRSAHHSVYLYEMAASRISL